MKRYGSKTRKISLFLITIGIALIVISFLLKAYIPFEGLISLSAVLLFSGFIIYVVIYREFEKLERIADEIEKGKI